MTGDKVDIKEAMDRGSTDTAKRIRSTIEFPYNNQDDALKVVHAIHANAGVECTVDQLAAYMKQSPKSGAFRMRLGAARIFGLVETERGGRIVLTELGRRAMNPDQEKVARAESFLQVPLYSAIYEKFKGYSLPPAKALEREIVSFGVSHKQADRARQAFERAAEQAGYFEHGSDRLVAPALKHKGPGTRPIDLPESAERSNQAGGRGGGGDGSGGHHPFIDGLLKTLPPTDSQWPSAAQAKWLNAATQIFGLIYKSDNGVIRVEHEPPKREGASGERGEN